MLVVIGVSGSGKTSVGEALAAAAGVAFVDGDDLHAPEAVAKMARGIALDDADRMPWLDRIGATLADAATYPRGVVMVCSALRRAYRGRLRRGAGPGLRFVFLDGSIELIRARIATRRHRYMPASLLASQFAALEPPVGEADVVRVPIDGTLAAVIAAALQALGLAALPTGPGASSRAVRDRTNTMAWGGQGDGGAV
jgi:gluconokinase